MGLHPPPVQQAAPNSPHPTREFKSDEALEGCSLESGYRSAWSYLQSLKLHSQQIS